MEMSEQNLPFSGNQPQHLPSDINCETANGVNDLRIPSHPNEEDGCSAHGNKKPGHVRQLSDPWSNLINPLVDAPPRPPMVLHSYQHSGSLPSDSESHQDDSRQDVDEENGDLAANYFYSSNRHQHLDLDRSFMSSSTSSTSESPLVGKVLHREGWQRRDHQNPCCQLGIYAILFICMWSLWNAYQQNQHQASDGATILLP